MKKKFNYYGSDLEVMSNADNYYKWILKEFKRYIGKNVAEIGAGSGNFTNQLLLCNLENLSIYEPSTNMFSILKNKCKNNNKIKLYNDSFNSSSNLYKEYFDTIVYINVLEHIEDDKSELKKAYIHLKKGGQLLIFVPALNWLYSEFDKKVGHYRRYHKKEMKNILILNNFNIKKIKYFDFTGAIIWYFFSVLLKKDISNKSVTFYDKIIIPIISIIENKISPIIGKNLLVIAQKL